MLPQQYILFSGNSATNEELSILFWTNSSGNHGYVGIKTGNDSVDQVSSFYVRNDQDHRVLLAYDGNVTLTLVVDDDANMLVQTLAAPLNTTTGSTLIGNNTTSNTTYVLEGIIQDIYL